MTQTTARIKKGGKHYEILVDLEEALKFKRGEPGANINAAVLTDAIFNNLKSGEHAGNDDLEVNFETSDIIEVATKIIRQGEVVKTTEFIHKEQDKKYKQVVDFLSKNAASPEGRPYTPDRIMKALSEAHIHVKNKPIDSQMNDIINKLSKILPLKIEKKKIKITVSSLHVGKAYSALKEHLIKESWLDNGSLEAIIEIPTGMLMNFYDRINSATHGSVLSEELKN